MTLTGYAAHYDKTNLNGERVTKGAFDRCINTYKTLGRYPFINYNHDPTQIIGVITDMHTDEAGLIVTAEIDESSPLATHIARYITNGKIDAYSTEGYIDNVTPSADGTYTAAEFYITAVAIVPLPADPDATFAINNRRKSYFGAEIEQQEHRDSKRNNNQIIILL